MSINFGGFTFDLEKTLRYLKQDLRDDWFQDPLLYEDRFNREDIVKYFEKNIAGNCGIYRPVKREILNVPKSKGTLRYSLEMPFYDRVAYHTFGVPIVQYLDASISKRVLSHRLDDEEFRAGKSRYLFLNAIEQWKKFDEYVRIEAKTKTVLITDIQNYYENINLEVLRATLLDAAAQANISAKDISKIRFCIETLIECLKSWSYNGVNGLPQNRDISSFLANMYMLPVDTAIISSGADYYRYMDDIRIVCSDKFEARDVLKKLILLLRSIGLTINSSKTEIVEPGTRLHIELFSYGTFSLERLDAMINSKKKPIVAMAFSEIKDMLIDLQSKNDFTSRAFRFSVGRICKIALCTEIVKPTDFFEVITQNILDRICDLPEVTDQFYSYLMAVEVSDISLKQIKSFLLDKRIAVYGWQNYLLWRILVYRKFCDAELIEFAREMINTSDNVANVAGALLYIGGCGGDDDRDFIASSFSTFDGFFTQRHALIGIQELDFKTVKEKVEKHICDECIGIYRTLKSYKVPKYMQPPVAVKFGDLVREVSFYA